MYRRQVADTCATGQQFLLKNLRIFPSAKTVRYEFLRSGGKPPFAKILLEPAKPVLRIEVGGTAAPPSLPGDFGDSVKTLTDFGGEI